MSRWVAVADDTARACAAYHTVRGAVSLQTRANVGPDPAAVQAVAANLDPATPPHLAVAIRSFADDLQGIAMNALARVTKDDRAQAALLHDAETAGSRTASLCSLPAPLLFGGLLGP